MAPPPPETLAPHATACKDILTGGQRTNVVQCVIRSPKLTLSGGQRTAAETCDREYPSRNFFDKEAMGREGREGLSSLLVTANEVRPGSAARPDNYTCRRVIVEGKHEKLTGGPMARSCSTYIATRLSR